MKKCEIYRANCTFISPLKLVRPFLVVLLYLSGIFGYGSECYGLQISQGGSGNSFQNLRIATWNLHHLDKEDTLRISQIAQKIQEQKADIYALQEIADTATLRKLTAHLGDPAYRGFAARYIPYDLRMSFLYRPDRIDSLSAFPIPTSGNAWVQRSPFLFSFLFTPNNQVALPFHALNIHAKADIPNRYKAYQDRRKAADQLYRYLQQHHSGDRLIVLGDFNDDLDRSIYQNQISPYHLFRSDFPHFRILTLPFTAFGRSTTLFHSQPIDHIIISNELFKAHKPGKLERIAPFTSPRLSVPQDTLSDHYMVVSELQFNTPTSSPENKSSSPSAIAIQHAPNPFHEKVTFHLDLPETRRISLRIHNSTGTPIKQLITEKTLTAGHYNYQWRASSSLANGIYYYQLMAGQHPIITRPLTLFR